MTLTGLTITNLSVANDESVVQQSIINFFQRKKNLLFNRFDRNDGVLYESQQDSSKYFSVLFEFKHDTNLLNNQNLAKKLVQSLIYLYKLDNSIEIKTPRVVAIVDKDEFVYLHTNQLVKYLSLDVNWDLRANDAYKNLPELYKSIYEDLDSKNLVPIHHKISEKTLPIIYDDIVKYCKESIQKRPVTSNKIKRAFDYWEEETLITNLKPNDSVNLFVQIFINPSANRLNEAKNDGTLITESFGNNKVKVDKEKFSLLMRGFDVSNFSNLEKKKITSTQDTLILESERRRLGAFYTQDIWAQTADQYYDKFFPNYKSDGSCVWDKSAGTGNITRNRRYSNLILSTKEPSDVDTIIQSGYNSGALLESLDALNFTYESLPHSIRTKLESSPIIHMIENPPYATSANFGSSSKANVSDTLVKKIMNQVGLGNASDQLFNQFLFQNYNLSQTLNKKVHIGYFMKPIYFTGEKTKELREFMGKKYKFRGGFVFNAKEFSGVKSWPLIFAVFENGIPEDSSEFEFDILERQGLDVVKIGTKTFYNTDNVPSAKEWVKKSWIEKTDRVILPPTKNGFDYDVNTSIRKDTMKSNSLGFLHNNANSVQYNSQMVGLYTQPFQSGNGLSFDHNGFWNAITLFNARKLVQLNWLNDKDEYLAPNEEHVSYNKFKNMCLVRSLFSEGSNQTSWLTKVYNGISYRITNEFFPFKKEHVAEKINVHPSMATFDDYNSSCERYVAKLLWDEKIYNELPKQAQDVLNEYKNIYLNKICLMTDSVWDIGYVQIRKSFPNDFNIFDNLLNELDKIMIPLVYELGFLKK